MADAWALLSREREVVEYYLREHVFPLCMQHRVQKFSATGEELGGDALFGVRL